MKNFNYLKILVILIIVSYQSVYSQKTDYEEKQIIYTKLPLVKLPESYKTYSVTTEIEKAPSFSTSYTAVMGKLVLNNYIIDKAMYDFKDDQANFEKTYLNISGYTKVTKDADFQVVLWVGAINQFKTLEIKPKNTDGTYTYKYHEYWYKADVYLYIKDSKGNQLYKEQLYSKKDEYVVYNNQLLNGVYTSDTEAAFISADFVPKIYSSASTYLKKFETLTGNRLGIKVYYGVGKKMDYSDLVQAKTDMISAIEYYNNSDTDNANIYFQKAIDAWLLALKESDLTNKKARINEKVTEKLCSNLAWAYLFKNEFSNATIYNKKLNEYPLLYLKIILD